MDIRDTITELHELLMPRVVVGAKRRLTKKDWEMHARRNFDIIVGMVIGKVTTAEQIKDFKGGEIERFKELKGELYEYLANIPEDTKVPGFEFEIPNGKTWIKWFIGEFFKSKERSKKLWPK